MTSASKKIYLTSSAFGLGIALTVGLIVAPLIRQISIDSRALFQKNQDTESFFQAWRDMENSKKDYEEIRQELEDKPALLTSQEAIKFILAVEEFAQATQSHHTISMVQKTLSPENQPKTSKQNTLDFQISLWGTFPNLIRFLIYLENAPYYNNVTSLQISRLTSKDVESLKEITDLSAGNINSVITLSVYQQDEISVK